MKDCSELNSDVENPKFKFYHLILDSGIRGILYWYCNDECFHATSSSSKSYEAPIIPEEIISKFKKEGKKFYLSINSRIIYSFEDNKDLQIIFHLTGSDGIPFKEIKLYHSGNKDDVKEIQPKERSSGCTIM